MTIDYKKLFASQFAGRFSLPNALKSFIHLQRATSFTADPHEKNITRNRFGVLHAISTGKHPGKPALADFERGNFVQQFLDQTQRADPAADGPAQHHPEQGKDAHHIPWRCMSGSIQRILQRTKRAACDCPRAGIAVEAGNADALERS